MRSFLLAFASLICADVAQAEPTRAALRQNMTGVMQTPAGKIPQDSLENMSMEQQMAVCGRLEMLQKQGKALTKAEQAEKAVCEKMRGTMDIPAQPAPSATLER
ncbi:hypothetical protein [Acetobacter orleanensis]|uniref:Uncharacterized protein n=1 Tax=Acetobacter orleanensis TaxID=104099 RepID=A0A4Y3TLS0_9PROT|nr:hypothetical protein [Acetobacter orleanensis]KXV63027.1 hypothetical protein AD949_08350 [Acetobacter orleanensis]PCD78822.1 hypothetical protein CO710_10150 [Acetobacter orleanensis]GAN68815.1 hypothetical protein Abol_022_029 [Acetobacter orleanensis JCM 7639]GBR24350.1 hypothetical protein AA0473_0612 [Acetobacter orleanensis NRIC 0473]GEB83306.1 hypothetical protein AOR01nite_17830 [Acetobacter orleanensis]